MTDHDMPTVGVRAVTKLDLERHHEGPRVEGGGDGVVEGYIREAENLGGTKTRAIQLLLTGGRNRI